MELEIPASSPQKGPDYDGLYIWEDAHLVEILDPDCLKPVDAGEHGIICVTVLFKNTIYPVIRFNTNDVSTLLPGRGAFGINFRRLEGFRGRSDNMVKLRGINVYPTGIGAILERDRGSQWRIRMSVGPSAGAGGVNRHGGDAGACDRRRTRTRPTG